jgi:hypothetical protein
MSHDLDIIKKWIANADPNHIECRLRHHRWGDKPTFERPTRKDPHTYWLVDTCKRCEIQAVTGISRHTHHVVVPRHYPTYPEGYLIVGAGYRDLDDQALFRRAYVEMHFGKELGSK